MVLDDNLIDNGPEWRAFDYEQLGKRSRTGAPSTFSISDKGLSTVIDWKNKDYSGRNIPERNRAQIERLRRWHKRLRISNSGERSLVYGLSELDRQASTLGITRSIREDASLIYRTAAKESSFVEEALKVWLRLLYILLADVSVFLAHWMKWRRYQSLPKNKSVETIDF